MYYEVVHNTSNTKTYSGHVEVLFYLQFTKL